MGPAGSGLFLLFPPPVQFFPPFLVFRPGHLPPNSRRSCSVPSNRSLVIIILSAVIVSRSIGRCLFSVCRLPECIGRGWSRPLIALLLVTGSIGKRRNRLTARDPTRSRGPHPALDFFAAPVSKRAQRRFSKVKILFEGLILTSNSMRCDGFQLQLVAADGGRGFLHPRPGSLDGCAQ